MNTSILDAIRDTRPAVAPRAASTPAPLDMAGWAPASEAKPKLKGGEETFDLDLLPVPPWLTTEAVVIGCAIAFATVSGFVLGLTYEGCLIGVCG